MRTSLMLVSLALVAAAGCGDDPPAIVDARIADAPVTDGTQVDAPPPMVTVIVTSGGAPVSGVPVYFQNADGSLVAQQDTASGVASALMMAGGSATAILGGTTPGDSPLITTFQGVKPGDTLRLTVPSPATAITFDVTIPANGTLGHYGVQTPCGSTDIFTEPGTTVTFPITLQECGATTDFLILSDNGDGGPTSTIFVGDVAIADATAVTLTGTYERLVDAEQTYTNLGNATDFNIERKVIAPHGELWSQSFTSQVVSGTAVATLQQPARGGTAVAIGSRFGSGLSYGEVAEAPASTTYALDTTGVFLTSLASTPQFDPATATVEWTENADGAAPQFTITQVEIGRGSLKAIWDWRIVGPHAGTSLVLPTLPGDAAVFNPTANDGWFVGTLLNAKVTGGYDAVRGEVFNVSSLSGVALGRGRVVTEQMQILAARRARPSRHR